MAIVTHGEDAFGRFHIKTGFCGTCDFNCGALVQYVNPPEFPEGIERARTILKGSRKIGIDCGCYGKLHRQVAHISDGIKRRKLVAPERHRD